MNVKLACILCVLILCVHIITISPLMSNVLSSTTQLCVEPSKVEYWTPASGESFMINVSIIEVFYLRAFEFKLYWNTTLLDLIEVDIKPFLNPPTYIIKNETREDIGRYWLTVDSAGLPKTGSGVLASLSFEITYEPVWPENATSVLNLADTQLIDQAGQPISHTVSDGEYSLYGTPPLNVTVTTDKSSYYLVENIHIHGNLILGLSPVEDGLVSLEMKNTQDQLIVIRTLPTGTPPVNNFIDIVSVIPCDDKGNPKNSFRKGGIAYFNTTVKNIGTETQHLIIAVNVYDINTVPLSVAVFEGSIAYGSTLSTILSVPLPTLASTGGAWVYASALSNWPSLGGAAYCPEKSASFTITQTGGGAAGGSTYESQVSGAGLEGTYNLTFKLLFDEKPGSYTIYAGSNYEGQHTANNTTFKIKIPDLNDDGIVDIFDKVIVGSAFGATYNATDGWYWHQPPDFSEPCSYCPHDPRADIINDGTVDIFDKVIVGTHFGCDP